MWTANHENLSGNLGSKFSMLSESLPMTYGDVLQRWVDSTMFRSFFTNLLAASTFTAFRWETPPISLDTLNRPFEFVLLDSPGLDREADEDAFAEHFRAASAAAVVAFANLGGDAVLVVPCPIAPKAAYGHLASFLRNAPPAQQDSLWQAVGRAMRQRVGARPVWLSTAGAGVSWLHVRLDDRPKYYGYGPYR